MTPGCSWIPHSRCHRRRRQTPRRPVGAAPQQASLQHAQLCQPGKKTKYFSIVLRCEKILFLSQKKNSVMGPFQLDSGAFRVLL